MELVVEPELDIVCVRSDRAVAAFDELAEDGWHVATLRLDDGGTALRCCLLKREHLQVVDALADALIRSGTGAAPPGP